MQNIIFDIASRTHLPEYVIQCRLFKYLAMQLRSNCLLRINIQWEFLHRTEVTFRGLYRHMKNYFF